MGMYTTLEDRSNLKILNQDELDKRAPELNDLFNDEEIKFFYYWTESYINVLSKLGKDKILEGEIEIYGEDRDYLICKWSEDGFFYKFGEIKYPEEWIKG